MAWQGSRSNTLPRLFRQATNSKAYLRHYDTSSQAVYCNEVGGLSAVEWLYCTDKRRPARGVPHMTTFCIIVHSSHMSPKMCAHLSRSGEKPVCPSTTRGCVIDDSPPCTIVAASAGDCTMSIDAETPMGMGYEGGIPSKKWGKKVMKL